LTNFTIATNEFRGSGAGERTEYHIVVAWDSPAPYERLWIEAAARARRGVA
jgi:hypothetical protein